MPQQFDPNATRRACEGWYLSQLCDGIGIMLFEDKMLCRLCYEREASSMDSRTCEADVLTAIVEGVEQRARCRALWTALYVTPESTVKRLCRQHYIFQTAYSVAPVEYVEKDIKADPQFKAELLQKLLKIQSDFKEGEAAS